ncbi:MATE family efflux transporter [Paenibacillus sp. WLX2291]|uniref:MATE family efflux transporter n=1 Tax=Paenibacillus sp. WLX2291 TaxID=3296934 RepID=UPI00398451B4
MTWITRDRQFYTRFFRLTFMIGLQNIITVAVAVSDNLILGGYSETALSASALANQIQFIATFLMIGCAQGVVIVAARYRGSGQEHLIGQATSAGMVISLGIGIVMWLASFLFATPILSMMTNEEEIVREGALFLTIIAWSYVFYAVTNVLLATLRSLEIVRIGLIVSVCTLVVNIVLNIVLVYGYLGLPSLGVEGSAIATLISRIIECLLVVGYVRIRQLSAIPRLRDYMSLSVNVWKSYIQVSLPILLASLSWAAAMALQTGILGHMGTAAIAANSVATSIFQFVTVGAYAAASASSVIMGKTVGEGNMTQVKLYSRTLQFIYVRIGLVTGIALYVLKDHVLFLYSISPDTRELALTFMTILSITVVGTSYEMPSLSGIVQSGGDTKFVMYNDFIFMWLLILPLSLLGAFVWNWSPVWIFLILKSDQMLKCIVAAVKVNRYRWIKNIGDQGR